MSRDFSELDLQLVMHDFNDTEEERADNVIAGVAIRSEDAEAFAADVERLAVEKYGGATFAGLLDEDLSDESMAAAWRRKDAERNAALLEEAERAMAAGMRGADLPCQDGLPRQGKVDPVLPSFEGAGQVRVHAAGRRHGAQEGLLLERRRPGESR